MLAVTGWEGSESRVRALLVTDMADKTPVSVFVGISSVSVSGFLFFF